MIVPQFWAEAVVQAQVGKRQLKVRRFGWSDLDQAAAQAHAQERAQAAATQLSQGVPTPERERKAAYNGADGVPIREEVLARHGQDVITRNAYGAHCLNSPHVLFVDIDYEEPRQGCVAALAVMLLYGMTFYLGLKCVAWWAGLALVAAIWALRNALTLAQRRARPAKAKARVAQFSARHPDWGLRLYSTPAGLRVIVTHQAFSPDDAAVSDCFAALQADPLYVRMCRNQQCFRARLTAKPWRIGVAGHMRPRPGFWPVTGDKLALRQAWVQGYEQAAAHYRACAFEQSLGVATIHDAVGATVELHDRMCRAHTELPMA